MNDLLEHVPCALCGSTENRVIIRPRRGDMDVARELSATGGVRGNQRVVRCTSCGLVYVDPRPRRDVLVASYEGAVEELYVQGMPGRARTFASCLAYVERWRKPPGRLLDVGCATGNFVACAAAHGWDAHGVDACRSHVLWGREHMSPNLHIGTLAGCAFPDASFDVVTMWDVLEHLADPVAELRECNRILRPGGVIAISVPDFGSIFARMTGRHWWWLVSSHIYHFTTATAGACLAKAGFKPSSSAMHWQWHELGFLTTSVRLYSPRLARLLAALTRWCCVDKVCVPFYASQTRVAARKQ